MLSCDSLCDCRVTEGLRVCLSSQSGTVVSIGFRVKFCRDSEVICLLLSSYFERDEADVRPSCMQLKILACLPCTALASSVAKAVFWGNFKKRQRLIPPWSRPLKPAQWLTTNLRRRRRQETTSKDINHQWR